MRNILKTIIVLVFSYYLTGCSDKQHFDVLVQNGNVFDGTGTTSQLIDIGIRNDRIVAIGNLSNATANRIIDAQDLVVAPGFIDMHAHLDPLMTLPECESMLRQGVTTALGGPDGSSPMPLKTYMDSLEKIGIGMNVGYLIGHNTIRRKVMNLDNRPPTDTELSDMKQLVKQGMDDGAFGISTGLKYLPGTFSEVDEVIELSKVAAANGGIYTSHLREEGLGLIDAVQEAMVISEKANIPVILTHHKVMGKPMWGKSVKTLAMVDSARLAGLDIKMDQYPYNASYTGIAVLIPNWSRSGGAEAFKQRVADPVLRDSIKAGIVFNIMNDRGGNDLDRVQFALVRWMPELEGKTLKYWCEMKGLEPTVENGADLVIEAQLNGGASCVFHAMDQGDVERIMQHPMTMIGSDGRLVKPGQGHPHPRWYGSFPRILGRYVREKQILTLEEAIYKMTGLSASSLGLTDRGTIKEGNYADLTLFDPATVIDKSTFEDPHQYPEGIAFVLVNGKVAVDDGEFQDKRSGQVLRKN
jgi:N-acyl-D-amino-acid deacylase